MGIFNLELGQSAAFSDVDFANADGFNFKQRNGSDRT
jgi:hypothetical protein